MAAIAQLGERQTEDLEVPSSILGHGILHHRGCPQTACEREREDGVGGRDAVVQIRPS